MKKLFIILALLLAKNAISGIDTLRVKSNITNATVFFSGAQVTRQAELKAVKGTYLVILDKLSGEINPQTIQVKGLEDCSILSVRHQLVNPTESTKGKEEKMMEDKVRQQEMKIKEINNRINVFDIEEKMLLDNSVLGRKDNGPSITEIKEAADFYRARINEIRLGRLNLSMQVDSINEKIKALYARINEISADRRKTYSQVLITIECKKDVNDHLFMSYYVPSAGWKPTYDFRVEDISKPLSIIYNAGVFQSSGEKWDRVRMKLSTNNPSLSGNRPEIRAWYLGESNPYQNINIPQGSATLKGKVVDAKTEEPIPFANIVVEKDGMQVGGTTSDFDGNYTIKPVPSGQYAVKGSYVGFKPTQYTNVVLYPDKITFLNIRMQASVTNLQEISVVDYKAPLISKNQTTSGATTVGGVTRQDDFNMRGQRSSGDVFYVEGTKVTSTDLISNSLKTNITNLEYTIDIPYTIPSDGEDYNIKIKEVGLPVNFIYHAVPKLERDVFLTAEIPDWSQLNLLTGKSSIYYQGTYVGESFIDVEKTSDTLGISLGRDNNIIVERKGNKEVSDKRVLGDNIKETLGWDITVRNKKSSAIRIIVEDQFPVSVKKSIDVEKLEYLNATLDERTGKLSWTLDLAPGEKKSVSFKYAVKYSQNLHLKLD